MASSFQVRNWVQASLEQVGPLTVLTAGHVDGNPAVVVKDPDGDEHTIVISEREKSTSPKIKGNVWLK